VADSTGVELSRSRRSGFGHEGTFDGAGQIVNNRHVVISRVTVKIADNRMLALNPQSSLLSRWPKMKNIQIIDGAENCVYDIFAATEEQFALIFPDETDIAFIGEIYERESPVLLDAAFNEIWKRPIKKKEANGIHGIIFYELDEKKKYYPSRKDDEAVNPNGSFLRKANH
jgi:hypothetical protein